MEELLTDFRYACIKFYEHAYDDYDKFQKPVIDAMEKIVQRDQLKDLKIKRLENTIEFQKKQVSDASWIIHPDRMGGQGQ